MNGEVSDHTDLIRLAAVTEVLLPIAERVDGGIVDEAILAELYELLERAYTALGRFSEH